MVPSLPRAIPVLAQKVLGHLGWLTTWGESWRFLHRRCLCQSVSLCQGGREPNSTDPKPFNGVVTVLWFLQVPSEKSMLVASLSLGKTSEVLRIIFISPVFSRLNNTRPFRLCAHTLIPLSLSSELSPYAPGQHPLSFCLEPEKDQSLQESDLLHWVKFSPLESRRGRGLLGQGT